MTVDQLKNILNTAILVLQDNQKIVSSQTLDGIDNMVKQFSGPAPTVDFNTTVQAVLQDVELVVGIEKRLIETTLTDDLVGILSGIQNHPLLMRIISRVL